jgi:hypothetical protein
MAKDTIRDTQNVLEVVEILAPEEIPLVRNAAAHGLYWLDVAQEWLEKN